MGPDEQIRQAMSHLEGLETVPAEAVQAVDALVHRIRQRLVLTEETAQEWRDVAEAAQVLDKSSASGVVSLVRTVKSAPTAPLPPRGWLSLDLAVLDLAKAINAGSTVAATS
ncbi:hypothetical protein FHX42_004262 [Saccharopolyspora lacisalsi]|uniref:Uncharacterized protein n=1 Tax=Halosaccharopolyspora lacisalsi TaxID=1000566 RepID=A0A839E0S1_9PSEU|nr:hypothetical protein [Halosaccharopolyspora lacisalsi]MBA8826883.1 hypothetical protein [Halosaccharopolyspora lacisalsi]